MTISAATLPGSERVPAPEQATPWIRSPGYDLLFVSVGAAAFTLSMPVLASAAPALLVPLLFWGWLFFFEGSHFWATYSRTYMDSKFRDENGGVLGGSLAFFAFPALAVLLSTATGNALFMNLYGFFIFSWSLYHNTRQHYGFVSIYSRKAGASDATLKRYRWGIYLATLGPMAHFFLSYKLGADFPGFFAALNRSPLFSSGVLSLPALLAAGSLLYFGSLALRLRAGGAQAGSPIALGYILTCMVFYNTMFFVVARLEPFYSGAENFAQKLMIIAIMNSLFHNIQYHAIVWHYSKKRYAITSSEGLYGVAKSINSRFGSYALAALAFSTLFSWIFWNRGEIRFLGGSLAGGGLQNLAYIVYFGVVGHHFYLDQKIWRMSRTRELGSYFALNRVARAA